jgi:hypothetical protein
MTYWYWGIFCQCGAFFPILEIADDTDLSLPNILHEDLCLTFRCEACESQYVTNPSSFAYVESSHLVRMFKPPR